MQKLYLGLKYFKLAYMCKPYWWFNVMKKPSWCWATSTNLVPCSSTWTNCPYINTGLSVSYSTVVLASKTTHYPQKYLHYFMYSLSIILFFENSSRKASGLLFIFICVSTNHAHFWRDEICISWEPERPNHLPSYFSSRVFPFTLHSLTFSRLCLLVLVGSVL